MAEDAASKNDEVKETEEYMGEEESVKRVQEQQGDMDEETEPQQSNGADSDSDSDGAPEEEGFSSVKARAIQTKGHEQMAEQR